MSTAGPLRYQLLPLPCPLTAASGTVATWSPWHRSPTATAGPRPQFTACPRPDTSSMSPSRTSGAGGPSPSHRGSHLSRTCRRPPCVCLTPKASETPRGRAFAFLTGAPRKGREASRRPQHKRRRDSQPGECSRHTRGRGRRARWRTSSSRGSRPEGEGAALRTPRTPSVSEAVFTGQRPPHHPPRGLRDGGGWTDVLPWTERVRRGLTGEGCGPKLARLICGKPPSFLDPRSGHGHAEQPLLELLGRPSSSLASGKRPRRHPAGLSGSPRFSPDTRPRHHPLPQTLAATSRRSRNAWTKCETKAGSGRRELTSSPPRPGRVHPGAPRQRDPESLAWGG